MKNMKIWSVIKCLGNDLQEQWIRSFYFNVLSQLVCKIIYLINQYSINITKIINLISMQKIFDPSSMIYRNVGQCGLKVSIISFGNSSYKPEQYANYQAMIRLCLKHGINHFDTAEIYANGQAEISLGKIIKNIGVDRENLVISTKVLMANKADINSQMTVNRKHVKQSVKHSLQKLDLDYVDIIYPHIYDDITPVEEICRSFNQIIQEGQALYWGVSNWEAQTIYEALAICQRLNLHKPVVIQYQYNMLNRKIVEQDFQFLIKKYGLGLISWSSLAGGFLTGKYLDGIKLEQVSRLSEYKDNKVVQFLWHDPYADQKSLNALHEIAKIANQIGCKLVHLALAWLIKFPYLSAALISARNQHQLQEIIQAIQVYKNLTPEIQERISNIIDNAPKNRFNFVKQMEFPSFRPTKH